MVDSWLLWCYNTHNEGASYEDRCKNATQDPGPFGAVPEGHTIQAQGRKEQEGLQS